MPKRIANPITSMIKKKEMLIFNRMTKKKRPKIIANPITSIIRRKIKKRLERLTNQKKTKIRKK